MTRLKELKKKFPELIKTSGTNYYIDGIGWYRQRTTPFGLETYEKDWNDVWTRINFDKLVAYVEQLHG